MSWPSVKIKDVAKVVTGKTPLKSKSEYYGGDIPFITPSELGFVDMLEPKHTLTELGATQIKLIPAETVMVCCIGSLGKLAIATREVGTNQQINSVIFDKSKVFPKFGFYALSLLKPLMQHVAPSTTVAIINKSSFENFTISLPPLEEQKRIAAILDKADAIRRKRQAAIELADQFLRSVFLDMFGDPVTNPKGWEKKTLGELSSVKTGSTPSRNDSGNYSGDIPWVKTTEVIGKKIYGTEELLTKEGLESSSCKVYPKESIVLAMYGQGKTRGRTGMLAIDCATNQACAVILPSKNISQIFLWEYLKLSYQQVRKMGRGGNQSNLNLSLVKSIEVILPPRSAQNKFIERVSKIQNIIEKNESQLVREGLLFLSLSQKAFNGELVRN